MKNQDVSNEIITEKKITL